MYALKIKSKSSSLSFRIALVHIIVVNVDLSEMTFSIFFQEITDMNFVI
jgi:hypothetical protein